MLLGVSKNVFRHAHNGNFYRGRSEMKNFLILFCICTIFLGGCVQDKPLDDLTKFSTDNKGDYLLFHFINPLGKEGYISEVDDDGKVIKNFKIRDKHFAPSDVFYYSDNFFFTSGAYSDDTKVMKYNPKKKELSLFDTNQKKFIEKYHKDDKSEYIITVLDKNDNNEVCDIKLNKCIESSESYSAHTVTTLDNYIIVVGINKTLSNTKNSIQLKKFNRNLEALKEVTLDQIPNYFTYTSEDQKLYIFMKNGDIVEIDSDLNVHSYPINISDFSENIENVKYNKNVMVDKKRILVDMEIKADDKKTDILAEISFEKDVPTMNVIQKGINEDILNVDYETEEVFTRSYVDKKTVISIRDTKKFDLKNRLVLSNKDPIYFVDNIK